jgi:hypothetical protein
MDKHARDAGQAMGVNRRPNLTPRGAPKARSFMQRNRRFATVIAASLPMKQPTVADVQQSISRRLDFRKHVHENILMPS